MTTNIDQLSGQILQLSKLASHRHTHTEGERERESGEGYKKLTAIGAALPGTFTAHVSPDEKEGRPSSGMLIPGNIKSAPPMTNLETSPPLSIKEGNNSGTFQRAKTA